MAQAPHGKPAAQESVPLTGSEADIAGQPDGAHTSQQPSEVLQADFLMKLFHPFLPLFLSQLLVPLAGLLQVSFEN